jgi:Polyketide cyclase / dehydrase and lipid transport
VWHVEQSVETTASPEAIWRCWTDLNGWPRWVPDFQWSRLDGPFVEGATFENKARGLPVAKVRIATVSPLSFFRTESRLLGMHLVFDHWVETKPTGTRIKTGMNFGGVLAPILWLFRGRAIALSTRESLRKLANLAVAECGEDSSAL